MKKLCYFALDDCAEKPQEMWIAQVYQEWIALPALSVDFEIFKSTLYVKSEIHILDLLGDDLS